MGRLQGTGRASEPTRIGPRGSVRVVADLGWGCSLQFLGRWFTAGLASNSTWFLEKKAKMSMCKSVVTPTEEGSLNLTTTFFRWDSGVGVCGSALGTVSATSDPDGDPPTGKASVKPGPCCCSQWRLQAASATPARVSGTPNVTLCGPLPRGLEEVAVSSAT